MKIVSEFPRAVREIENAWIKLKDGTRLAARIWLPEDAEISPVPAIFEFLPYRKNDSYADNDAMMHPYFAGHGYACVRVDIRGSGESSGVLADEYLKQEQDDACEIITWIANQRWCTGSVGMIGLSWSAFNSIQVAACQPPELKAIIAVAFTDDRYADDIHYMGGCQLHEHLSWATCMFAYNTRPPDPKHVGDRWRDMWLNRLKGSGLWIHKWLSHQRRDDYWKHASICEDYNSVKCPVYAVSGWADGYTNPVLRVLEHLSVPRRGLIGPWPHVIPHQEEPDPGPSIGFLQDALRWWDRWLKGEDTGIDREPMLHAYILDAIWPEAYKSELDGRWITEDEWPSASIKLIRYILNEHRIGSEPEQEKPLSLSSPMSAGLCGGVWEVSDVGPELPHDQREDDGKSLVFDSDPLTERLEVLGLPIVELELECDKPQGQVAVRLCDVWPDGSSTRVSYGLLNLTHRAGHEEPQELIPGRRYRVRVQLNVAQYSFPKDHRIRVSVSNSYWPLIWPSPEKTTLTVFSGASAVDLPVRTPRPEGEAGDAFPQPEHAPPFPRTTLRPSNVNRTINYDISTNTYTLVQNKDTGAYRHDADGLVFDQRGVEYLTIKDDEPNSARSECNWTIKFERGDWRIRTETRTVMTSTKNKFLIRATLDAFEGEELVHRQSWDKEIPRDMM
jgi:uncharacterized protein